MITVKSVKECVQKINSRDTFIFLMMVFAGDLFYFIIHTYNVLGPRNPLFHIGTDGGYPEFYQYVKFFWISILLIYIAKKKKSYGYFSWALLFLYFMLDDSLQFHESGGRFFEMNFQFTPPLGMELRNFGELVETAIAGLIIFVPLFIAYKKGKDNFRKVSHDIIVLIGLLLFCGMVIDELNEMLVSSIRAFNYVLVMLEDGGEMLSTSLITWYVFWVATRDPKDEIFLFECIRNSSKKKNSA
ncbi:MAG: hypothetical protein IPM56_07410 [Ignavibacteriales bacterium]|nr:MAG: hypothetical protein IPM56_07410 [Ignavibacteriales bacterium]